MTEQELEVLLRGATVSRYKVIKGSQSRHCCFDATVVDTTKPITIGSEYYEAVCECFEETDAQIICDALNVKQAELSPFRDLVEYLVDEHGARLSDTQFALAGKLLNLIGRKVQS